MEKKKFSEVLDQYISACLRFKEEEKKVEEGDYYYLAPPSYEEAQERKDELAKEIDSFFPEEKEADEVDDG